ncbi:YegS/Rv2252/BmrU family lipid kinase [Aeromicrobium fastidiosum]|uniref:YegS/Rv2252/BmrU family lipid kinase n=1 Tax=Aeromicrobium fastidiosum TaxID=52699 RepID=A0A641AQR8_9ACTN|nr:YegS/Rv2252/BmrU family lipid kinase [Aeromicrobium fastidiosum]KAA1380446.1 YegS/Rv2252/BmrU family lipid kinase [Aeromicrobium fastidiosum]MBP2390027.1 YegS/Rv2252/BmrU family lipid kinase [Aeromicrobium fastidiosum]
MSFDLRRAEPGRPSVITWLVAVPSVVFAFLVVAVATETSAVMRLDLDVAARAYDVTSRSDGFVSFLEAVALVFGNISCAVVLALVAVYAFVRRERAVALWIVLSATAAIGGNALLKLAFTRTRPSFDEPLYEIGGYSFPSGHSAGAGMFFTVAILVAIILTGRGWRRRVLITVFVVLALGVGASRVFLGVHYLSDVVAGLSFGMAVTMGLWVLVVSSRTRLPHELAVITGTGRKRAAVVINPSKVGDVEEFKARVRAVAEISGWNEPLWYETTVEDPGHGQATAALHEEVDLIVAAGGDGTVLAVCEEVARTGTAVGILPHGTGNLLARNLGIPLNTRDALDVVFGGQDRAIDLSTLETDSGTSTTFLVMAGLGMDAAIMTGVNDQLKSKVGWLAYFVSGVKAARFPAMKVKIKVDDGEYKKFRARTVVVGNVGFLQGGIPLLPDAQIDDGKLDVVVIAPKRFIGWLAIIVRVVGRQKRTNERLDRLTGSTIVIKAEKAMPMQLDGDPVGEGREIRANVQPGVLLVRVPVSPAAA